MKTEQHNLVKNTLDQIPQAGHNTKHIVGLVKESGRITGYKLSGETFVSKPEAVSMVKQGQIAGIGMAHRGDTEYLKFIPNGSENDDPGNLPSVSRNPRQMLYCSRPPVFMTKTGGLDIFKKIVLCLLRTGISSG